MYARVRVSFNSKLVRLKGNTSRMCSGFGAKFQFQTGAIKSRESLFVVPAEMRFNSKLVRLKGLERRRNAGEPSFNSKLVRLKATIRTLLGFAGTGFNSKLVRLKVAYCEPVRGSKAVSIPNWCD